MKRIAWLGLVLTAGCIATDESPGPPEASEPVETPAVIKDMNTESWDTTGTLAAKEARLWPSTSQTSHLIVRTGPDKQGAKAFLVFVVLDHTSVSHVYWETYDSGANADIQAAWEAAYSGKVLPTVLASYGGGQNGSTIGQPPIPRPNVDVFLVSAAWQQAAVTEATSIDDAQYTFEMQQF